jgi:hypothetical protein
MACSNSRVILMPCLARTIRFPGGVDHSEAFTLDRSTHSIEALDADAADRLQDMLATARKRAV